MAGRTERFPGPATESSHVCLKPMEDANIPPNWKRMRFKRNKVWVAVDGQGLPVVDNGKVLIKYQLDQAHQYWVGQNGIYPLEEDGPLPQAQLNSDHRPTIDGCPALDAASLQQALRIYTDGACSGNPGPAGIGVVMLYRHHRKEISRYIGTATNNIAELEAIKTGLEAVRNKNLPVVLFTDSSYAMGLLSQAWKAKHNRELVERISRLVKKFKDLRFVKVRGHAGHPENERADGLATGAIQTAGNKAE